MSIALAIECALNLRCTLMVLHVCSIGTLACCAMIAHWILIGQSDIANFTILIPWICEGSKLGRKEAAGVVNLAHGGVIKILAGGPGQTISSTTSLSVEVRSQNETRRITLARFT